MGITKVSILGVEAFLSFSASLVTQPMMQRRLNRMELRSMDSYTDYGHPMKA